MDATPDAAEPVDTGSDSPPAGKGGRNMPVAIAAGVAMGLIAIAALFISRWVFVGLICAIICVGIYELTKAFAHSGIHLTRTPLYLGAISACAATYYWGLTAQLVTFGVLVVAILMWRIRLGTQNYVRDVTSSVFVAAYLPFMVGFIMLTLRYSDGPQLVIVFVALTICSDIGGLAAGVKFGKHPIAPKVSPAKSWEGFAGSLLLQALVGAWLFVWLLNAPWWQGVIAGLVMTVTATAGDFAESAIKRDLGVKDMSHLIPGHGGLMDRLDSLIPNAFVSWALFALFFG